MPQGNHLFYIRDNNPDGENLDLLVVAPDKAQAVAFWTQHFELPEGSAPEWVGAVPGVAPTTAEPGAIDWEAIRMD
ncbi:MULTISPECIES: hypothetical protein [unclassified Variovorax]|uniref:hypothetical protein n=1 Tax=unclassified Variovorax TaxID=663243 RepID=UPI00076CDAAA|nr:MULTISPECIES: hypothetical protein [unclassified Variovorax]KWT98085.1 hypothetical protein APY03_0756 [Variovorax sp. WDL1]PNG50441.1 hypothetical protein CHC06_06065 [Variovorax sp. B2]PNG51314.1 hypothetical protein CHC07_05971 [Variovorax sp. B4]VTU43287.1 hypothetical protein H6P1_00409 [Variovorax sp. PBL-H6]VTU43311.1 hypothetical protein SRS16P1_00496 [Variovorax sp. SRS16]